MKIRAFVLLFMILLYSLKVSGQLWVPECSGSTATLMEQGNCFYCISGPDSIHWKACRITASDIHARVYNAPDKILFKDLAGDDFQTWNRLEDQTRIWALEFDSVFVVTGKLPAGCAYFKAILKGCLGDAIGFVVQQGETRPLTELTVDIDSLETLTGIDFFSKLQPELQEIIEKEFKPEFWPISF